MTGGYASYVGFVPEQKIGVVVLGNTATGKLDDFAVRSLKRLAEARQIKPLVRAAREQEAAGGE
jgi:CubicO group peptidase (beta-lactamase class C family)